MSFRKFSDLVLLKITRFCRLQRLFNSLMVFDGFMVGWFDGLMVTWIESLMVLWLDGLMILLLDDLKV